jgi:hypothetical protein
MRTNPTCTIDSNGAKRWYLNGQQHRVDGPAIEYADGTKEWYLNGDCMTEAEHKRRTSPIKELTVAEIEQLLGHPIKVVK